MSSVLPHRGYPFDMTAIVSVQNLSKTYASGFSALSDVNLAIERGEILALLGPNGAGKTTLISIICGIVNKTSGTVTVDGHDNVKEFRAARRLIGLVPQELHLSIFETVWDTVKLSRKLYGKPKDNAYLEKLLRLLALWDKKDAKIMTLSGGMKRRVLVAKALAHQPAILFLDEPTAGVDVELRKDMWEMVRNLQADGVTIILTTHYIEEAEEMADRVGIINKGRLILVEKKARLMKKMGHKRLILQLAQPLAAIPAKLAGYQLKLQDNGMTLSYSFDSHGKPGAIPKLLGDLGKEKIAFSDLHTEQNSLEDIFIGLVAQ
jgi:ABC-2 type transport system ATP-binding protein